MISLFTGFLFTLAWRVDCLDCMYARLLSAVLLCLDAMVDFFSDGTELLTALVSASNSFEWGILSNSYIYIDFASLDLNSTKPLDFKVKTPNPKLRQALPFFTMTKSTISSLILASID